MRVRFWFMLLALVGACSPPPKARVDAAPIDASPGRVTFYLILPAGQSFCEPLSGCPNPYQNVRVTTAAGDPIALPWDSSCQHFCLAEGQCGAVCVTGVCPAQGVAIENGTRTWNGVYDTTSACGADCLVPAYATPGEYKAQLCATPGTLTTASDAGSATCTNTGAEICGPLVPFTFPQAASIDLPLVAPDGG